MDDHMAAPGYSSTNPTARSSICGSDAFEVRFRSGPSEEFRGSMISGGETTTALRTLASLSPLGLEQVMDDSEVQSEEKDGMIGKWQVLDPPVIDKTSLRPRTATVPRRHESTSGEEIHRGNTDDVEYQVVTPPGTPRLRLSEANQIVEETSPRDSLSAQSLHSAPDLSERMPEDVDAIHPLLPSRIGTPSTPKPTASLPVFEEAKVEVAEVRLQFLEPHPSSDISLQSHSDHSGDESHPAPSDFSFQHASLVLHPIPVLSSPSFADIPPQTDSVVHFPQVPYKRQPSAEELQWKCEEMSRQTTPKYEQSFTKMTYVDSLDALKDTIAPNRKTPSPPPRGCLQAILKCCSLPPLSPKNKRECDILLSLSERSIEDKDLGQSLIYSIWTFAFPGETFTPENAGIWRDLGFRSCDPRTEATALELLQLLYLFSEEPEVTKELLRLSRTRGRVFNFVGEITQITKLVTRVLRSGKLNSRLQKDVWKGFNTCFLSCVHSWGSERSAKGDIDWHRLEERLRKDEL